MQILGFLEDPPVVQKILLNIGEPTQAPEVLSARALLQGELALSQMDSPHQSDAEWREMDQTVGDDEIRTLSVGIRVVERN